jgi:hypothetical protein
VSFAANAASRSLAVQQGSVIFDLNSQTYTVGGPVEITQAALNLVDGNLLQTGVQNAVALSVGNNGFLGIGKVNSGSGDAFIGPGPQGAIVVVGGAGSSWSNIRNLALDTNGPDPAQLNVSDQGAVSVNRSLTVGSGSLVLVDGVSSINVGAGAPVAGALRVGAGGVLTSGAPINGDIRNDGGRVRPGNSPGILSILGDFTQTADGTLEIEVGGLTPGTQHDLVTVVPPGVASIDGNIDVPFINGYAPAVGQQITFLTAATIIGEFKSITAPNLDPNIAVTVNKNIPGGGLPEELKLQFVAPLLDIQFDSDSNAVTQWSDVNTWENVDPLGQDRVPDERDVITVASSSARTIEVTSGNPQTHSLQVAGGAGEDDVLTIDIKNNQTLSAVIGATVGRNAVIDVESGSFTSAAVEVNSGGKVTVNAGGELVSTSDIEVNNGAEIHLNNGELLAVEAENLAVNAGGLLSGNGLIAADVTVGAETGAEKAVFLPGGNSAGRVTIDGDYQQGDNGELALEVAKDGSGDIIADKIDLTGKAAFGGKLTINLAPDVVVTPQTEIEVITADALADGAEFKSVRTIGQDDVVFFPIYNDPADQAAGLLAEESAATAGATVTLVGGRLGDMNRNGVTDMGDAAAFATAFVDPAKYTRDYKAIGNILGNCNEDDYFDFQDIEAFRQKSGVSMSVLLRLINQVAVPEPGGVTLAVLGVLAIGRLKKRR